MGWRKTGETRTATREVSEMFCDVCGKTIPLGRYPRYELTIETGVYRHEGDAPETLHICSWACLDTKAGDLGDQEGSSR